MRFDKLTTKLQEAISEASSVVMHNNNQYIEPSHVLLSLLNQADSTVKSLLKG